MRDQTGDEQPPNGPKALSARRGGRDGRKAIRMIRFVGRCRAVFEVGVGSPPSTVDPGRASANAEPCVVVLDLSRLERWRRRQEPHADVQPSAGSANVGPRAV